MGSSANRDNLQLELARILTSPESPVRAPKRIFDEPPSDWRDLERKVAQTFVECGCEALCGKAVNTVRGKVNADVVVHDKTRRPHQLILCECKRWQTRVPKTVVHAFRTVVADSGANLGYIISDQGFQSGSRDAARNANVRLVTGKQFQAELFDRWFNAMEQRLTGYCDAICALKETTDGASGQRTLADRAVEDGGESASQLFEQLQRRYVQFSFASSKSGAGKFRRFPFRSIHPSAPEDRRIAEFRSPRTYFDAMLNAAPGAFRDYAIFLLRYTDGMCGTYQLFDDRLVRQIRARKSDMMRVQNLLGHGAGVRVNPNGEVWTYWGTKTLFQLPERNEDTAIGHARTFVRSLTVEFDRDGKVERTEKKRYERKGV